MEPPNNALKNYEDNLYKIKKSYIFSNLQHLNFTGMILCGC